MERLIIAIRLYSKCNRKESLINVIVEQEVRLIIMSQCHLSLYLHLFIYLYVSTSVIHIHEGEWFQPGFVMTTIYLILRGCWILPFSLAADRRACLINDAETACTTKVQYLLHRMPSNKTLP